MTASEKFNNFIKFCEEQPIKKELQSTFKEMKNISIDKFMAYICHFLLQKYKSKGREGILEYFDEYKDKHFNGIKFEECADKEVRDKFLRYMEYFCEVGIELEKETKKMFDDIQKKLK